MKPTFLNINFLVSVLKQKQVIYSGNSDRKSSFFSYFPRYSNKENERILHKINLKLQNFDYKELTKINLKSSSVKYQFNIEDFELKIFINCDLKFFESEFITQKSLVYKDLESLQHGPDFRVLRFFYKTFTNECFIEIV